MSSETYENYVARQTAIFSEEDLARQKQDDDNKLVYNDLLARFHLLQNSLKDEQQKVEDLKDIVRDYMQKIETFSERVVEIPFSLVKNLFSFQENPTSIFISVSANNKLIWAKGPEEMNDPRISS